MRILIFIFTAIIANTSFAQQYCGTAELQEAWFLKHPELKQAYLLEKQKLVAIDQANSLNHSAQRPAIATAIYTIPVVFHILHTGGVENISDAQVTDAVNILTRDFNKLNADTANVVVPFKSLIGNPKIEFQLATLDPNGNCTNGIIRHWDGKTNSWDGDFGDYQYSWPSNKYLNIYVVRTITFNAAGYTYLPGSGVPSAVDAIVVLSSYVGSIGTSQVGLSRVLTHEVGHWLNLEHTWGWNTVATTCGDDGISDTPITKGFTSCSLGNAKICNPTVTENVQNYMDYAYCENMFTIGQANWMQNTFTVPSFDRDFLSDPQNLLATGITNPGTNCLPHLDIHSLPGTTACVGKPLSLKSYTWNAAPSNYQWSSTTNVIFTNPNSASTTVNFTTPGTFTIYCQASNSAGAETKSIIVVAKTGIAEINATSSEGFENPTLPSNWTILNPTTINEKWTLISNLGINGSKCMYVPGENMSGGSVEILESPSYDFKNNPGAIFSFKYAYARKSPTHNDIVKLQASKNCGATWSDVWVPGMSALCANSGGVNPNLFIPTIYHWKTHDVTSHPLFIPFINEENVRFRLYFEEDPNGLGNRFYLDDITFATPVGLNELGKAMDLNIFPNPTNGKVAISFNLDDYSEISISLSNVAGRHLIDTEKIKYSAGKQSIEINKNESLTTGIYFLTANVNGVAIVRKLVVN